MSRHLARLAPSVLLLCLAAGSLRAQRATSPTDSTRRAARDSAMRAPFTRVSGEQLMAAPAFTLEQALQGKLLGTQIDMNDGAPWSDGQVSIRGIGTLTGDPSPLVVIDGVLATNPLGPGLGLDVGQRWSASRLQDLTPFDIESIEVLRGPVATTRYGVRGANGVLLITTRRGTVGSAWRAVQRVGQSAAMRVQDGSCFASVPAALRVPTRVADSLTLEGIARANGGQLPCVRNAAEYFGQAAVSYESAVQWRGGARGFTAFGSASQKSDAGAVAGSGQTRTTLRMNLEQRLGRLVTAGVRVGHTRRGVDIPGGAGDVVAALRTTPSWRDLAAAAASGADSAALGSNPFWARDRQRRTADDWRTTAALDVRARLRTGQDRDIEVAYLGGLDQSESDVTAGGQTLTGSGTGFTLGTFTQRTLQRADASNHRLTLRVEQPVLGLRTSSEAGVSRERLDASGSEEFRDARSSAGNALLLTGVWLRSTVHAAGDRLTVEGMVRSDDLSANGPAIPRAWLPALTATWQVPVLLPGDATWTVRAGAGRSGGLGGLGVLAAQLAPLPPGIAGEGVRRPQAQQRTEYTAGTEVGWRRLRVSYDGYVARIGALWLAFEPPAFGGAATAYVPDAGTLGTSGHEVALRGIPFERGSAQWQVTVLAHRASSRMVALGVPASARSAGFVTSRIEEGTSITALWSRVNDESITVGNAAPSFDAAITNQLRIGPVLVRAQVDVRRGADQFDSWLQIGDAFGASPDFASQATLPRPAVTPRRAALLSGGGAAGYVQSGRFVRLRELVAEVELPARLRPPGFRHAPMVFSVQGRNLALWSDALVSDPEFSAQGTVAGVRALRAERWPLMRQLFVGLTLGR